MNKTDLSKILHIEVTKKHIKDALTAVRTKNNNACLSSRCPIAQAVNEKLEEQINAFVTYGCVSIYGTDGRLVGAYKISTRALKFMERFDTRKIAVPQNFKFQLI